TTQSDVTGDGVFDNTRTDVSARNADGSETETITDDHQDGSLADQTVTIISANKLSATTTIDATGDGHTSATQTSVTNADGSATQTVSDFNDDGSQRDQTVTTTTANGLSITTQSETFGAAGAVTSDQTRIDATVLNSNGSRTETVRDLSANNTLVDETV